MKGAAATGNIGTELQTLFKLDQADRTGGHENIDIEKMRANDKLRLQRAKEIHAAVEAENVTLTGEEMYYLAMLFQHSSDTKDYLIAQEVANMAAEKGSDSGKWLSAAAEDRYLLAMGEKQKWGTQFTKKTGAWEQLPMQADAESKITDEMRTEKRVPKRRDQMNTFLARKDI